MTTILRVVLIVASVCTFSYIIINIRKAKVRIDALFFWILFGLLLIVLSVFPQIAIEGAKLAGFYAPINFLLVTMIFLLLYKVFTLTMRLSSVQQKLEELVQSIALKEKESEEREKSGGGGNGGK